MLFLSTAEKLEEITNHIREFGPYDPFVDDDQASAKVSLFKHYILHDESIDG